jgi:Ni,Fe-hydrogenase III large subunit
MKTYTNEIARLKELFEDLGVVCSDLPFKTVISYIINIPENQMNNITGVPI